MQAIIYARFSTTGAQAKGDSIPRQLRTCEPFCATQGYTVESIVTDKGRSGYKGHHRIKGEFGTFEREALAGHHVGKVLVVERLDRLSRERRDDTYDLIRSLTKAGVTIATVEGPRFYEAYKPIEFGVVLELLVKLQMAHDESAKKADHARHKWQARRERIGEGRPVSALCPAWLRLSEDRQRYEVVEGRDLVIQRIYDLADSGLGSQRIAIQLNNDGIAPWPRFAGREPRAWSRGFVLRIMTDRAVTGDHQPHQMVDDQRVPVGDPVRGYYPRIIEPDLFARVSAAADSRKGVRGNKGHVPNLFAGLIRCSDCGSVMNYRATRKAGHVRVRDGKEMAPQKSPAASLECQNARDGGCEMKRSIAYVSVEKAMLNSVLHLALDDAKFARRDDVARLDVAIADRQRDHDIVYERAVMLFEAADSPMALTVAKKKEAEAAAIKTEIEGLMAERATASGQVSATEQLSRLAAIRDDLTADDEAVRIPARLKVAQAFRDIVTKMEGRADGSINVSLLDGARVLYIKPQRGRREPEVWDYDLHKHHTDMSYLPDDRREKLETYRKRVATENARVNYGRGG